MEDEKETEKDDEYEKHEQGEERWSSFMHPAARSPRTFKSLKNNVSFVGRGFSVWAYLLWQAK